MTEQTTRQRFNEAKNKARDSIDALLKPYKLKLEKNFTVEHVDTDTSEICAKVYHLDRIRDISNSKYIGSVVVSIEMPNKYNGEKERKVLDGSQGLLYSDMSYVYRQKIPKKVEKQIADILTKLGQAYCE